MIQRVGLVRNKFILFVGLIIFLTIFLVFISSSQSNESLLQQKIERLELQNENYNRQIEVEKIEQKQRLTAEHDLYEHTKKELNQKLRDLKEIHDKENQDARLRLESIQQQYKILKTEHEDLEVNCEREKKSLATNNDGLKSQNDKVQAQLSKFQVAKENDVQIWKVKYENLQSEKEKLEKLLQTQSTNDEHHELIQLKYKLYQIEQENKHLRHELNMPDKKVQQHQQDAPQVKTVEKNFGEQIPAQDSQNVLQQPMNMNGKSSTTTTTTTPTSVAKQNLKEAGDVKPQSSTSGKTSSLRMKPLPKGVLPIPDLDNKNELQEAPKPHPKEEQKPSIDETLNKPQNIEIDESENRANEEHDNDIDIEEKNQRSNLDDALNPDKNIVNNAAEEFDAHKPGESKKIRNDEMDLEIINRPNGPKDKLNGEIEGDHGKESDDGYPGMEDLHMIEGQQEEADDLGDVGEYDDPKAIKEGGVAERN